MPSEIRVTYYNTPAGKVPGYPRTYDVYNYHMMEDSIGYPDPQREFLNSGYPHEYHEGGDPDIIHNYGRILILKNHADDRVFLPYKPPIQYRRNPVTPNVRPNQAPVDISEWDYEYGTYTIGGANMP